MQMKMKLENLFCCRFTLHHHSAAARVTLPQVAVVVAFAIAIVAVDFAVDFAVVVDDVVVAVKNIIVVGVVGGKSVISQVAGSFANAIIAVVTVVVVPATVVVVVVDMFLLS